MRNEGRKQVIKMADISLNIWIIKLNANGLGILIKRQRLAKWKKSMIQQYAGY